MEERLEMEEDNDRIAVSEEASSSQSDYDYT